MMFDSTKRRMASNAIDNMQKAYEDLALQTEWYGVYVTNNDMDNVKKSLAKIEKSALQLSTNASILKRTL